MKISPKRLHKSRVTTDLSAKKVFSWPNITQPVVYSFAVLLVFSRLRKQWRQIQLQCIDVCPSTVAMTRPAWLGQKTVDGAWLWGSEGFGRRLEPAVLQAGAGQEEDEEMGEGKAGKVRSSFHVEKERQGQVARCLRQSTNCLLHPNTTRP